MQLFAQTVQVDFEVFDDRVAFGLIIERVFFRTRDRVF